MASMTQDEIDSVYRQPLDETFGVPKWKDPFTIYTATFRPSVWYVLSPCIDARSHPGHIEIRLAGCVPNIDAFSGIYAVDTRGIWWHDGDCEIDDYPFRQHLIPWRLIDGITLHAAT